MRATVHAPAHWGERGGCRSTGCRAVAYAAEKRCERQTGSVSIGCFKAVRVRVKKKKGTVALTTGCACAFVPTRLENDTACDLIGASALCACAAAKGGGRKRVRFPLRRRHFVLRAATAGGSECRRFRSEPGSRGSEDGRTCDRVGRPCLWSGRLG